MLKSNFFRPKNFNVFYIFEPEKISESPLRAPTWPEKNPISEKKKFISEIKISISEVEITDFRAQKEERSLVGGLSPLRYTKILLFGAKSKSP